MILQTSKKYKTIKHIVLSWGERELLRHPYPIFIIPLLPFWGEDYKFEISHNYKGKLFSLYFVPSYEYPMHLKTKFLQLDTAALLKQIEKDIEEDSAGVFDFAAPVKDYKFYFSQLSLSLSARFTSCFYYNIYSKMFDQSQLIVRNMDSDKENLFEGIGDIKIDVSESPYKEELLYAFQSLYTTSGGVSRLKDPYFSVDKYYQAQTYRYGLEESKSLLLMYLGEQNPEGYSGVNENFFKNYTLRLQLAALFEIHSVYSSYFSGNMDNYRELNKVNLWKTESLSAEVTIKNSDNAERFYLRRFYRKFRLLNR
jgi:hypothetical protein